MNREKQSRQRFVNIFIAFAIAWLSMSSIIDFHIHKIYEKDVFGKIEFIKTDSKKSAVFKTDATQKIDLNSDFCEFYTQASLIQLAICINFNGVSVFQQQQLISSAISLRGPPSIKA